MGEIVDKALVVILTSKHKAKGYAKRALFALAPFV